MKSPLGKPRLRWRDNIKMNLKEVGCEGMDLIYLIHDRLHWLALVNEIINLPVA
jgi:hypothetical protein